MHISNTSTKTIAYSKDYLWIEFNVVLQVVLSQFPSEQTTLSIHNPDTRTEANHILSRTEQTTSTTHRVGCKYSSMVHADGLALVWSQDICNQDPDVDRSVHIGRATEYLTPEWVTKLLYWENKSKYWNEYLHFFKQFKGWKINYGDNGPWKTGKCGNHLSCSGIVFLVFRNCMSRAQALYIMSV